MAPDEEAVHPEADDLRPRLDRAAAVVSGAAVEAARRAVVEHSQRLTRRRRLGAVAVGIVVIIGGVAMAVGRPASPGASRIKVESDGGASKPLTTGWLAQRVADHALPSGPVRPGWRRVGGPPVPVLRGPATAPGVRHLAHATRFWTAAGSLVDEQAWLRDHPPSGYSWMEQGSMAHRGSVTEVEIRFRADDHDPRLAFIDLAYSIAPWRNGAVAIRLDAQVGWGEIMNPGGPNRLVPTTIGASPITTVTITYGAQTCGIVRRPTAGRGGVPIAGTGDALEAPIVWPHEFTLEPPGNRQPTIPISSIVPQQIGPGPVTKLALLTDPLHGDHDRLVWATFYAQAPGSGDGGYGPKQPSVPTTQPADAPCEKAVWFTDAVTGQPIYEIETG